MQNPIGLIAAAALGIIVTIGVEAVGQSAKQTCVDSPDLSRLNKRFDELGQAITGLQTQSAKAASDSALANANNQRQLANIVSQIAELNVQIVALSGRINTLPPASR